MQFRQMHNDPVAPLSQQGLGYWAAAAMMAAEAYKESQQDDGAQDTGADGAQQMPGGNPSVPKQPSAVNTVSPAIQTTISPQISPTMVQNQSSPGASVAANPMQYMPGGQSAETGVSPYGNYAAPGYPGTTPGVNPLQPYGVDPYGMAYPYGPGPGQTPFPDRVVQSPSPWAPLAAMPWTTLALVGGGLAAMWMYTKNKRRRT